ncbi:5-hydroxytryptamine receptor 2A-like isoform X2 [Artemia franciscana]|uniref:5-hydroxytryptamine receptor 2A-like isoform X2 n=1 Tax=Artemia franciscana TaxID=6661 RepID=UPI0032D9C1C6
MTRNEDMEEGLNYPLGSIFDMDINTPGVSSDDRSCLQLMNILEKHLGSIENLDMNRTETFMMENWNSELEYLVSACTTGVTTPSPSIDETHTLRKFVDLMNFYYLAIAIIFGIFGNILSFAVFTRTHLKIRSSSYYLAALSLVDTGFLSALFVSWLVQVDIHILSSHNFVCQLFVYISSCCSWLSVWLTVAFTFERLVAVQYPLRRPAMCTVRRAKVVITILVLIALPWHAYSFILSGVDDLDGKREYENCDVVPEYKTVLQTINIIDTILTLLLPLIALVSMNILIAKSLFLFSKTFGKAIVKTPHTCSIKLKVKRASDNWEVDSGQGSEPDPHSLQHSSAIRSNSQCQCNQGTMQTTAFNGQAVNGHEINGDQLANETRDQLLDSHQGKKHHRNILSTRTQYSITKMLLLISTAFVLLNLPSYLIWIMVIIYDTLVMEEKREKSVTPIKGELYCKQSLEKISPVENDTTSEHNRKKDQPNIKGNV